MISIRSLTGNARPPIVALPSLEIHHRDSTYLPIQDHPRREKSTVRSKMSLERYPSLRGGGYSEPSREIAHAFHLLVVARWSLHESQADLIKTYHRRYTSRPKREVGALMLVESSAASLHQMSESCTYRMKDHLPLHLTEE